MSNVLNEHTRQQALALGRLGWSLRRIEEATGVRRETASGYLKAAGVPVRGRGGRPRAWPPTPATTLEVSTDPYLRRPGHQGARYPLDLAAVLAPPGRAPRASTCEPYRDLIVDALGRGRNAMAIWQDLVDDHGFPGRYASVRRVVVHAARPALRSRPASSSRRPGARQPKSITARAPWSVTRTPASTAARGSSSSPSATPAKRSGSSSGGRARASGPNSTSAPSAGWGARCASSCSTTSRRASSPRTSTTRH